MLSLLLLLLLLFLTLATYLVQTFIGGGVVTKIGHTRSAEGKKFGACMTGPQNAHLGCKCARLIYLSGWNKLDVSHSRQHHGIVVFACPIGCSTNKTRSKEVVKSASREAIDRNWISTGHTLVNACVPHPVSRTNACVLVVCTHACARAAGPTEHF